MSTALKSRPLPAPKVGKARARELLQDYIELMDALRHVQARMARLSPRQDEFTGQPYTAFYGASEAWKTRQYNVRTIYDEVESLAVAINLQAL